LGGVTLVVTIGLTAIAPSGIRGLVATTTIAPTISPTIVLDGSVIGLSRISPTCQSQLDSPEGVDSSPSSLSIKLGFVMFSFFSSFDSVLTGVGVADAGVVVLVLELVLAAGLSDLAPAKALPKRLFPPALNLGLVSLPLTSGAGGGGVSDEVEGSVEEEVVRPDMRDARDATGSVSLSVFEVGWGTRM